MSKQLTRRDFLKGTAAGALGFAALGLTGVTAAKADSIYTPGTYMATVKGYSSYVTVSITVDESMQMVKHRRSAKRPQRSMPGFW